MIEKLKSNIHIFIAFLVAAYLRIIFIFVKNPMENFIFSDMKMYWGRAESILRGEWHPQHFFQPIGFTSIIAFAKVYFQDPFVFLKLLHLAASMGTLGLIYLSTKKVFDKKIAFFALMIASFHYPFIMLSSVLLAETLFTFFIALVIYLISLENFPWSKKHSIFIGIAFFLSFLLKGTFAFYPILLGLWALLSYKKNFFHSVFTSLVFFAVPIIFGLFCHGLFTVEYIGNFQLSASSGGLNLVEGKCPSKYNKSADGYWWHSPLFVQTKESVKKEWEEPFTNSSYYTSEGVKCIIDRPSVLIESLRYIPYTFINNELWPSLKTNSSYQMLARNYNLFTGFILWPLIFVGLIVLFQAPRSRAFLSLVLPVMTLFFAVWLFKSEVRFRIPFDSAFIPIAAFGLSQLLEKFCSTLSESRRNQIMTALGWGLGIWMLFEI